MPSEISFPQLWVPGVYDQGATWPGLTKALAQVAKSHFLIVYFPGREGGGTLWGLFLKNKGTDSVLEDTTLMS